jgi:phytoene desaturase
VPGGARRFDAYYKHQAAKYRATYEPFLAADASDVFGYLSPRALARAARFRPWRSLHAELMADLGDERLAYALSYPAKYLGLHPRTCSSVFSVIAFLELAFGVWHPMGGFRALAAALARAVRDKGGALRLSAEVRRIVTSGGRARGVELASGERLMADEVIVNADWADARRRLLAEDARPTHDDASIERRAYSCSAFMLYLGMDRVFPEVPHHTIHLSRAVHDQADDRTLDMDDPPFYVCNPCVTDPSSAPRGQSTLYVLVPCPNTSRPIDWRACAEPLAARVLERLALVGVPNAARHVVHRRVATAETWRDDFRVFRGAVFNLAHSVRQLGPLRPRSQDEDLACLHWVGGGTHPGSGLLTILESARIAAARIARAHGASVPEWRAPQCPC